MSACSASAASASRACGTKRLAVHLGGEELVEHRPHLARGSARGCRRGASCWSAKSPPFGVKSISCVSPSHTPKCRTMCSRTSSQSQISRGFIRTPAASARARRALQGVSPGPRAHATRSGSCASRKPSAAASTAGSLARCAQIVGGQPGHVEQPRAPASGSPSVQTSAASASARRHPDLFLERALPISVPGSEKGTCRRGKKGARCRGQRTQPQTFLRPAACA